MSEILASKWQPGVVIDHLLAEEGLNLIIVSGTWGKDLQERRWVTPSMNPLRPSQRRQAAHLPTLDESGV